MTKFGTLPKLLDEIDTIPVSLRRENSISGFEQRCSLELNIPSLWHADAVPRAVKEVAGFEPGRESGTIGVRRLGRNTAVYEKVSDLV
jgi:hypothetical protein